jgi:hypothetical protein
MRKVSTPRAGRVYHFSYPIPPASENPDLHERRDGDAFSEILPVFARQGYEFEGLLMDHRDPVPPPLDLLRHDDLVVLTTRPPLDDHGDLDRKYIQRIGGKLEEAILEAVRPFFHKCRRSRIVLSPEITAQLGPFRDRSEIEFRSYQIGYYRRRRVAHVGPRGEGRFQPETRPGVIAAFALVTPIQPNGPHLVIAFGMDGTSTLIWCHLLRTRFSWLIESPGFGMVEILTEPIPEQPATLSFADHWQAQVLLDTRNRARRVAGG